MRETISISLNERLKEDIDKWAATTNMTRSSFVKNAVIASIKQYEAIQAITDFNAIARVVAMNGSLNDEQRKDLERIQQAAMLLEGIANEK